MDLYQDLKNNISGDIRFDVLSRKIYSVDASIYEVEPIGIIVPKDKRDVRIALKIASQHGIPAIARGAATGITGGCLGKGLIIDTSKYLNNIIDINTTEEYAIIEPGVVQDRLNEALSPIGYRLGPDTSTGNRATIGGMVANNSAGARSLHYGRMVDHVQQVEVALAGGQVITFGPLNADEYAEKRKLMDNEGHIYREVHRIINKYRSDIKKHFPRIPRHVSGYNLDALLDDSNFNLSKLIVGSEGTLGIVTQIKVKIAKKPRHTGLCIIHVRDTINALKSIGHILTFKPIALEMIDDKVINGAKLSPAVHQKLHWLRENPQSVFIAEFEGSTPAEVDEKLSIFSNTMKKKSIGYEHVILVEPKQISDVWDVRRAGLGLLLSKRSYNRATAFIEDISVAPENLARFIELFGRYLKRMGKEAGIYGHLGSGCMHIRPYLDLRSPKEVELLPKIMQDISSIVLDHGGSMSGEHGDGLVRSWLNEKMFGKEVYQAFIDIKAAFDPHNLMNPGKITNGPPVTQDLRLSPDNKQVNIKTFLDFSHEGGLELAADLCNGNGQCRKMEGTMCPSFQATGDEYDTTRARAQSLRSIINGRLPLEELSNKTLYNVLDLCLECKGCKKECPSQVDMAKMKSEVLYHYQQKHGYSLRSRFFAHLHTVNRFVSPFATLFNRLRDNKAINICLNWLGITTKRELPALAKQRFSVWFRQQKPVKSEKKVALFNDTYTEFNQPEIGKAAYKVFRALGYEVILIDGVCCGRPLISKGFLETAKTNALLVANVLQKFAEEKVPVVVLEPSCVSALRDDYKGLLGTTSFQEHLGRIITHIFSFDEFIQNQLIDGKLPLDQNKMDDIHETASDTHEKQTALVHGHCHQKALVGMNATIAALKGAGYEVKEIESGCCGVAGSFGYEKEHYDISMKIGELRLLPTIRNTDLNTVIVASGTSCRSQIQHGTIRKALHLAEAIANKIDRTGCT